jgi:hypothetical protein
MDRQVKTSRLTRVEIKRENRVIPRSDRIENDWCTGIEDKVALDIVRDCQLLRCLQRTASEIKTTSVTSSVKTNSIRGDDRVALFMAKDFKAMHVLSSDCLSEVIRHRRSCQDLRDSSINKITPRRAVLVWRGLAWCAPRHYDHDVASNARERNYPRAQPSWVTAAVGEVDGSGVVATCAPTSEAIPPRVRLIKA